MRDKTFYLNAIKMDLFRVVTSSGDLSKKISWQAVSEFLKHALMTFEKFEPTNNERALQNKLEALLAQESALEDPHKRLRWAENVLTIRSLL